MDTPSTPNAVSGGVYDPSSVVKVQEVCPQCHQPVMSEYYYCPNCGFNLREHLDTSVMAQINLYAYTLIAMPLSCYLLYHNWKGLKYYRSGDPKARRIGLISIFLLGLTVVLLIWSTIVGIQEVQSYVQNQETQLNNIGGF